ncbi:MAG: YfhO family protein [Planctomycetota bacterium]
MRRSDVFSLAGLLLVGLVFLAPALFTERVYMPAHTRQFLPWRDSRTPEEIEALREVSNLAMTDQLFMFHPQVMLNRESLRQGELPLWNPYVLGGVPHLQQQVPAVSSPLVALTLLMDPLEAWGWIAALQLSLAGVLMFLFLRVIGKPTLPSLVGGLVFALSGWMTSRLHYYQITGASIWLPLALLGIEGIVRGRRLPGALAIALAIGMAFVAGFPQVAVITAYLTGGYAVWRGVGLWKKSGRKATATIIGVAAAASVWGLLLASFQMLPAAEFAFSGESSRSDMTLEAYESQSLSTEALVTFLAPEAFGTPDWYGTLRSSKVASNSLLQFTYLTSWENFVEITGYIGILPLLLAVLGLLTPFGQRAHSADRYWSLMTIVALLVALGTPLLAVVFRLPGMSFGDPKRFFFVTTFGLSVLAAHGAHRLLAERLEGTMRLRMTMAIAAFLVALAGLNLWVRSDESLQQRLCQWIADSEFVRKNVGMVSAVEIPSGLQSNLDVPPEDLSANVELLRASARHVAVWALISMAWFSLLLAKVSRKKIALIVVTLIGAITVDLSLFGLPLNRAVPETGMYESSPLIGYLQQDRSPEGVRFLRYGGIPSPPHVSLMPNTGMLYGLHDAQGYITLTVKRYEELFDLIEPGRGLTVGVLNLSHPRSLDSPLVDLLGIRYFLTTEDVWPKEDQRPLIREGSTRVFANEGTLPRAFLVSHVVRAESKEDAAAALTDPSFDPARTAIVEGELTQEYAETADPLDEAAADIVRYEPRTVVVEVAPEKPSLLVLTDNWLEGWRVTVDGEDRPIVRTDYTFRGVEVRPGDQYVYFRYSPPEVQWGLGLMGVSGAAWLLALIVALWRSRRSHAELSS